MNKLMTVRQQVRLRQWSTMVQEREESGLSIKNFGSIINVGVTNRAYKKIKRKNL